ncbi:MAG TPA: hypothetical protein VF997_14315 [Polyangia bacterium]
MRRALLTSLAAAGLAAAAGACDPYYAPPIRAVQYGAPARLEEGRVEIGATAGGTFVPDDISPHLGVGIRDWVALEVGGNFLAGAGNQAWALGFVGPRFSYAPHRQERIHLISDLELGVGAGVGGVRDGNGPRSQSCSACDGLSGLDRVAGGGYVGFGVGAQIAWFSLYGRARLEASTATNVPATVWPSGSVGAEFNLRKRAAITVAAGCIGYANSIDRAVGWFYQVGLTLFVDAFARRHAPATSAAPPTPPRPTMTAPQPPPAFAPPPDREDYDEPRPDDADSDDDNADSDF